MSVMVGIVVTRERSSSHVITEGFREKCSSAFHTAMPAEFSQDNRSFFTCHYFLFAFATKKYDGMSERLVAVQPCAATPLLH